MFKKILRILTYHGDGDNICRDWVGMGTLVMGMGWEWGQDAWGWGGDGDNVTGMGWGWGCKFIPVSIFSPNHLNRRSWTDSSSFSSLVCFHTLSYVHIRICVNINTVSCCTGARPQDVHIQSYHRCHHLL